MTLLAEGGVCDASHCVLVLYSITPLSARLFVQWGGGPRTDNNTIFPVSSSVGGFSVSLVLASYHRSKGNLKKPMIGDIDSCFSCRSLVFQSALSGCPPSVSRFVCSG